MTAELISKQTSRDVAAAVAALRAAVETRGITVSAVIDHAEAARQAGLHLPGETVVIFGNPAVGTAVMAADPRAGLDLPLRVLVREVGGGAEFVYRDPRALAREFDVTAADATLATLSKVLDAVTDEAAA